MCSQFKAPKPPDVNSVTSIIKPPCPLHVMRDVAEDRPEPVATKALGTGATSLGPYLTLEECRAFVTLSPSLFSVTYVPSGIFWDSITSACIVGMSGPPCVESVCLRLMGRGLTVTRLTFTLTLQTDFHSTGMRLLCIMGEEREVPGYRL